MLSSPWALPGTPSEGGAPGSAHGIHESPPYRAATPPPSGHAHAHGRQWRGQGRALECLQRLASVGQQSAEWTHCMSIGAPHGPIGRLIMQGAPPIPSS